MLQKNKFTLQICVYFINQTMNYSAQCKFNLYI